MVYVPSFEPSTGLRTHHKVEILTALFAHMFYVNLFARKDFLIPDVFSAGFLEGSLGLLCALKNYEESGDIPNEI